MLFGLFLLGGHLSSQRVKRNRSTIMSKLVLVTRANGFIGLSLINKTTKYAEPMVLLAHHWSTRLQSTQPDKWSFKQCEYQGISKCCDAVTHVAVVPLELTDKADTYKKAVQDIE